MTPDQKMDRLERLAQRLAEPDLPSMRESRKQTEKLILLLEMQRKGAACANPETDNQIEKLKWQVEVQARHEARLAKRAEAKRQQPGSNSNENGT
jgi:hypothetical protein